MFYIKVKSQLLDLPMDLNIELVIENPLFLQDRIPVPYTTSAEFPLTPRNKKLLDQPSRVNHANRVWEYDAAEMGYGARPMFYGMLIVREISGRLSWNFQASDNLAELKKPMNELEWGTVSFGLADYSVRNDPSFSSDEPGPSTDPAAQLYANHWDQAHDDELDYTAAPIKTAETAIPNMYNDADQLEYIYSLFGQNQFFNATNNFGDNVMPQAAGKYVHAPMYPQLRIYYIFKRLLGLPDSENPFFEGDLKKMVLTSHFHPNFRDDLVEKWAGMLFDNDYPDPASPAENLFFDIASYQSNMPANEVLKSMLNLVAGTVFRYQEGAEGIYRVRLAKDMILDPSFDDWDSMLGSKLVLSREMALNYIYGYDEFKEARPSIDSSLILGTVNEVQEAIVTGNTGEKLFYIQTTDQLILKRLAAKVSPASPNEYEYDIKYSGLNGSSEKEGFKITSSIAPMKMAPVVNIAGFSNSIARVTEQTYLPVYDGEQNADYTPHVMMYWGVVFNNLPVYSRTYPYLSYHNYDSLGNRKGDLSLAWRGKDGLLANFHTGFKTWTERDKLLAYGEFIFSPYFIKDIDLAKKKLIRSKLWWIKKIVIPMTIKKISPAKVDLIESALISDESQGGSGSAGSTPLIPGICYTIEVSKNIFDVQEDTFQIQFRRPGEPLEILDFYNMPVFDDEPLIYYIYFCSNLAPVLVYGGDAVDSVDGVQIFSGGECYIDSECTL